jgi:hypothetical protein
MKHAPLALQTTYADLLDKLLDEQVRAMPAEAGTFIPKLIKGRRYWYQQVVEGTSRKQVYVGPETPELLDRIQRHEQLAETARSRRVLVRSLTGSGAFLPPVARVGRVLETLASAGVFRLRGVLVGTVAFGCYGPMLGIRLQSASLMTGDIDIAQFRSISIAVEDHIPPILEPLRNADPTFEAVTHPFHDRTPASYTTRAGDPLKVEFLTPMRGPDEDAPGRLPALSTQAQPLRFLDYLIHQEQPAAYLYGSGVLVNVPDPARFAWHKLILSERRTVREKVSKDLRQAETLFDALLEQRPGDVADMFEELAGPGRNRWQEIALRGLERIDRQIQARVRARIA